jgi:hypothetical protein
MAPNRTARPRTVSPARDPPTVWLMASAVTSARASGSRIQIHQCADPWPAAWARMEHLRPESQFGRFRVGQPGIVRAVGTIQGSAVRRETSVQIRISKA